MIRGSMISRYLAALAPDEAASALRAMGEPEMPESLNVLGLRGPKARHLVCWITYLALASRLRGLTLRMPLATRSATPGNELLEIRQVGNVSADVSLKNGQIAITLDRLRVAKYPGSGEHLVLFTFNAQNHSKDNSEELNFGTKFRVLDGEQAGLISFPIFEGLHVAAKGVRLKCRTVNVTNSDDQSFLSFLDSDVFNSGLKLVTTVQPALAPLSGFVLGVARSLLKRNENKSVQDIDMGLNFGTLPGQAHLAEVSTLLFRSRRSLSVSGIGANGPSIHMRADRQPSGHAPANTFTTSSSLAFRGMRKAKRPRKLSRARHKTSGCTVTAQSNLYRFCIGQRLERGDVSCLLSGIRMTH